ncbi:MAG TPA: DinB family protein [bacterium]|nr:DinB family protein [bacterium]
MRGADLLRQELAAMKGRVQGWSRAKKLAAFAGGTGRVTRTLSKFPRSMWGYTRRQGNWTITQVLWHLADQEAHLFLRLRKALAEPGGMVSAYDQEKWDRGLLYSKSDPLQAKDLLLSLRRANADLLKKTGARAWKGRVRHPEWGVLTLEYLVGLNIWHLEHHLAQMGRRFQEWKAR